MSFLTRNWLAKLGSLLFAVVIWYFISASQNTQASTEFEVPVNYVGLGNEQVVRGAPASVRVEVLGLKEQLNRLSSENFSAEIDFSNTEGAYEKDIFVVPPQGLRLVKITPATALGTVENIERKTVPIETSLLGNGTENIKARITTTVLEARVIGVSSSLEKVSKVIASVPDTEGDHVITLFAADANNVPVKDSSITVSPTTISAKVSYETVYYSKRVAINLGDVLDMFQSTNLGLSNVTLSQDRITLLGPKNALQDINSVNINVEPITGELTEGVYTLTVIPILPEGISSPDTVTLEINLVALPEETPQDAPDGDVNDSASTPFWRSGLKEARLFDNLFR
ncbi:MAG: hypothetical protein KC422_01235 [Trueperaceae bacterium]|nr:hypothetical protein [Trueperaceae bacterium]